MLLIIFSLLLIAVFISSASASYGKEVYDEITFCRLRSMTCYLAEKAIKEGLYREAREMDISVFRLTPWELSHIMSRLCYENAELFNVAALYRSRRGADGSVRILRPSYFEKRAEAAEKLSAYWREVAEIAKKASSAPSDLQKVIAVHDYICAVYEFDRRYYADTYDVRKLAVCDGVNMVDQKKGVCEGYVILFGDVMRALGIECDIAYNSGHVWNLVKLDGSWYHIDLTWDDKTPDCYGRVFHDHMLRSDKGLSERHSLWYSRHYCDSEKYDNAPWENAYSSVVFRGKNLFMVQWKTNALLCYDTETKKTKKICKIDKKSHSGLGIWKNKLYYNTKDKIYVLDADNPGKPKVFYISEKKKDIISLFLDEGTISCALGSYDRRAGKSLEITVK